MTRGRWSPSERAARRARAFMVVTMAAACLLAFTNPTGAHLLPDETPTPFHDYVALSYNVVLDATETQGDGAVNFTFYAVARIDMTPQVDAVYALYGETPTKITFSGSERLPAERYYLTRDCPDTITVRGTADATLSLRYVRAASAGMGNGTNFYVAGLLVTSVNQTSTPPKAEGCTPPVAFASHAYEEFSLPNYVEVTAAPSTLTTDLKFNTPQPNLIGPNVYAYGIEGSQSFAETLQLQKLSDTKEGGSGGGGGGDTEREKVYITTIEETANGARIVVQGVHQGVDMTVNLPPAVTERTLVDGVDASVEGPIDDGELVIVWVDKPAVTEEGPPGKTLGYFGVDPVGLEGKLINIKLRFHTLKTSVEEKVNELVSLFSFDEVKKKWEKLPTTLLGAEGDANQHEADVSHFSYFAIVLGEVAPDDEDTPGPGLAVTGLVSLAAVALLRPRRRP